MKKPKMGYNSFPKIMVRINDIILFAMFSDYPGYIIIMTMTDFRKKVMSQVSV